MPTAHQIHLLLYTRVIFQTKLYLSHVSFTPNFNYFFLLSLMNAQMKTPYTCLFLVLIQTMESLNDVEGNVHLPYFKGYRILKYLILRSIFIQLIEWVWYVRIVFILKFNHANSYKILLNNILLAHQLLPARTSRSTQSLIPLKYSVAPCIALGWSLD